MSTVDILAFGSHPDDVELGCGGSLMKWKDAGYGIGICDLTRGEMGTYGTAKERADETEKATAIIGAEARVNLDLGDARLEDSIENRHRVAEVLRDLRPRLVLAPWPQDLHPDHAAGGAIIRKALFDARLEKLPIKGPLVSIQTILYYPAHQVPTPTFVIDITPYFERKMEAVKTYRSQFISPRRPEGFVPTGVTDMIFHIESRMRFFGSLVNVPYGEAFLADRPLLVADPLRLHE